MSEYQFYDFLAVDRSLTESEMRALRAISTRARITPHTFTNHYNFGSFGGRPEHMMEKYFDLFVYDSNWGVHQFMLRLPRSAIDAEYLDACSVEDSLQGRSDGDRLILHIPCPCGGRLRLASADKRRVDASAGSGKVGTP